MKTLPKITRIGQAVKSVLPKKTTKPCGTCNKR